VSEDWGPWIEHDGRGFPRSLSGVWLRVEAMDVMGQIMQQEGCVYAGQEDHVVLGAWDWSNFGLPAPGQDWRFSKILRYQVRKPRVMTLLGAMAHNPHEVETVDALERCV